MENATVGRIIIILILLLLNMNSLLLLLLFIFTKIYFGETLPLFLQMQTLMM